MDNRYEALRSSLQEIVSDAIGGDIGAQNKLAELRTNRSIGRLIEDILKQVESAVAENSAKNAENSAPDVPNGTPAEAPPRVATQWHKGVAVDIAAPAEPERQIHTDAAAPPQPRQPPSEEQQIEELQRLLRRPRMRRRRDDPVTYRYPQSIENIVAHDEFGLGWDAGWRKILSDKAAWETIPDFAARIIAGNKARAALCVPTPSKPGTWDMRSPTPEQRARSEAEASSRWFEGRFRRDNGDYGPRHPREEY